MKILLLNPPLFRTNNAAKLRKRDDGDNSMVSIGLYSLASVLIEARQDVKLFNHALTVWEDSFTETVSFAPKLIGITCMTHNRKSALQWAKEIKAHLPDSRVIIGGVHASHLYQEILERCPAIDFVAVGEAETSLMELVRRLDAGKPPNGIPGIAGRLNDGSLDWPGREEPVQNLGSLPVASKYFSYSTLSSSRGCPYDCTFCCSSAMWGRRVREYPTSHVIEELKFMVHTHGLKQVHFKDETFTLRKERVEAICRGIIEEGLNIWWTCDTRVDCLDEERLYWMRKAGCFYLSFGIESGSPRMLDKINKKTKVEQIFHATQLARKYGMLVRYYLIVGLPDEKVEDLKSTVSLVKRCRPNFISVADLTVSPGTEVYKEYCSRFNVSQSLWFDRDEPFITFDKNYTWLKSKAGRQLRNMDNIHGHGKNKEIKYPITEEELRKAQQLIEDGFAPNYDLALYLYKAERYGEAIGFYEKALEIHPGFGKGWLDLGICQDRTGQLSNAVQSWEHLEGLTGEAIENCILAWIYRGLACVASGDLDKAVFLWKQAHNAKPSHSQAIKLIAEKCAENGRWEDAIEAAQTWATLQPQEAQSYHILALGSWLTGDEQTAETFFAKALNLAPNNNEIRNNYKIFLQKK